MELISRIFLNKWKSQKNVANARIITLTIFSKLFNTWISEQSRDMSNAKFQCARNVETLSQILSRISLRDVYLYLNVTYVCILRTPVNHRCHSQTLSACIPSTICESTTVENVLNMPPR